ncbi:MAG: aspartate aminotransferase family protein [Chloroflexi bacterium]|nr:aspartate aminotransferase family protein [Chloroflexota bacterium]
MTAANAAAGLGAVRVGELAEGDSNRSPRRAAWQQAHLDDATRELLAEDARWFLHQTLSTPCLDVLVAADGIWLEDRQGRRIMDFHGNSVHQVGFRNPRVLAAVREQLEALPFSTRRFTNEPAIRLARELARLAPGDLGRVLFTTSGATAMSAAIQLARVATGRHKTVSMWDAFHGGTLDTISVGGEAQFRAGIGPLLPGTEHVPPPEPYRCPFGCFDRTGACDLTCAGYLEYVLEKEGDVAAVVAESVRNAPYIPTAAYWQAVRAACNRHGALLILDEIPHALGRTGAMFTCENFGVEPDILVIGKGLGGGVMPLAALIARGDLNVAADRALGHFTHEKSPVACAAGLAVLAEIEERGLVVHARELGAWTLARLRELAARHPIVGDLRGLGLLLGIELVRDRATREAALAEADAFMYAALARGLNVKVTMGNVINLSPPLVITKEEMETALAIIDAALAEVEAT